MTTVPELSATILTLRKTIDSFKDSDFTIESLEATTDGGAYTFQGREYQYDEKVRFVVACNWIPNLTTEVALKLFKGGVVELRARSFALPVMGGVGFGYIEHRSTLARMSAVTNTREALKKLILDFAFESLLAQELNALYERKESTDTSRLLVSQASSTSDYVSLSFAMNTDRPHGMKYGIAAAHDGEILHIYLDAPWHSVEVTHHLDIISENIAAKFHHADEYGSLQEILGGAIRRSKQAISK